MIVGIISDTHDNLAGLKKAIQVFQEHKIELLIHCGDWVSPFTLEFFDKQITNFNIPIKSVLGNNSGDIKRIMLNNSKMHHPIDWAKRTTMPLDIDGKQAIVYHGEDSEILNAIIDSQKYDLVFTGHTHKPRNETVSKTLIINPGGTCYACEGEIIDKSSVAIYDSTTNQATIVYF